MALAMISSLTFRLPTLEHTFGTCVNLLKGKLSEEICISDPETLIITALRLICIKYWSQYFKLGFFMHFPVKMVPTKL